MKRRRRRRRGEVGRKGGEEGEEREKRRRRRKRRKTYLFLNYMTFLHKISINMFTLERTGFKIWHL